MHFKKLRLSRYRTVSHLLLSRQEKKAVQKQFPSKLKAEKAKLESSREISIRQHGELSTCNTNLASFCTRKAFGRFSAKKLNCTLLEIVFLHVMA